MYRDNGKDNGSCYTVIRDNGKDNGSYCTTLGDNGKENGNHYTILGDNEKEHGNYYTMLGDNGKENGNYYTTSEDSGKENGNYYLGFWGLDVWAATTQRGPSYLKVFQYALSFRGLLSSNRFRCVFDSAVRKNIGSLIPKFVSCSFPEGFCLICKP